MKRLVLALLGTMLAGVALVAVSATAGASTSPAARPASVVVPHGAPACNPGKPAKPTITAGPVGNLATGTKVAINGCGFEAKASVLFAECNGDGALGSDTSACKLDLSTGITTSSTGTFSGTYAVTIGQMVASQPTSTCPQSLTQASHGVECFVAAATTSPALQSAFVPIWFTPPPLTVTTSSHLLNGKKVYNVTIRSVGDYAHVAGKNNGGFATIGELSKTNHSTKCQATTNGKTWSSPGLPPRTATVGEVARIRFNTTTVKTLRVDTGASDAGQFATVIKDARPGTYTIAVTGGTSGGKASKKIVLKA